MLLLQLMHNCLVWNYRALEIMLLLALFAAVLHFITLSGLHYALRGAQFPVAFASLTPASIDALAMSGFSEY